MKLMAIELLMSEIFVFSCIHTPDNASLFIPEPHFMICIYNDTLTLSFTSL